MRELGTLPADLVPSLILLVSANDLGARTIESVLDESRHTVLRCRTLSDAIRFARHDSPDAILLVERLDEAGPGECCGALLAEGGVSSTVPMFVLLSETISRDERIGILRAGAWFVMTDIVDPQSFPLLIDRLLGARRQMRRLQGNLLVEEATGLYNRRGLLMRANEIGAHAARSHEPLACIVLSPVAEAAVPASSAPAAHGRLGEHLASIVQANARAGDVVGWWHDRELAIIAAGADQPGAMGLVHRIRGSIEAAPLVLGGAIRTLSLTAGICAVADFADSMLTAPKLLGRAADALHEYTGAQTMPASVHVVDEEVLVRPH